MSSALYKGLGYGLMSFGQNLQQQMADSAAQRRQDSLLALKRDWQIKDREWDADQQRQRDEELLHRKALSEGFSSVEEMQQHMGRVRGFETRALERHEKGELGPVEQAQINRAEAAAARDRAAAEAYGRDPAEDPVWRRQSERMDKEFIRQAPGVIREITDELAKEVSWNDKSWRNQLNRIPSHYLQGYTEQMGPGDVQSLIDENVRRGYYETHKHSFGDPEALERFRSTLRISDDDDDDDDDTKTPVDVNLRQQGQGRSIFPTVPGGGGLEQAGATPVGYVQGLLRGTGGRPGPEDESALEHSARAGASVQRAPYDLISPFWGDAAPRGTPVREAQELADRAARWVGGGLMDMAGGARAKVTGEAIPSGQQPTQAPAVNPDAGAGTPQNPLPFGEGEPQVGLYYMHPTDGLVQWDGEKWLKAG